MQPKRGSQHYVEADAYERGDGWVGVVYVDGYLVEKKFCGTEKIARQWARDRAKERKQELE
jgi:hypothetical protein